MGAVHQVGEGVYTGCVKAGDEGFCANSGQVGYVVAKLTGDTGAQAASCREATLPHSLLENTKWRNYCEQESTLEREGEK